MENDELKTEEQNVQIEDSVENEQTDTHEDEQTQPEESVVSKVIDDLGISPEETDKKSDDSDPEKEPPVTQGDQGKDHDSEEEAGAGKDDDKVDSEADLLACVKSERGKERLSKLLAEGRQNSETLQAMQRTINSAGLDKESFSNLMEISRLVSSNDPQEIERGLKAFEDVRTRMYQSLGREAPGVDLLAQYPDLAQKVNGMTMSREDALQIVQARQVQAAEKERYAAQKAQQQELSRIQSFGQQVQQTFAARSKEADFDARIEVLKKHFSRPGVVQQFVASNPPENWASALMWMYDNVSMPTAQSTSNPAPITQNRARSAGIRVSNIKGGSVDSIEERMRELGL